jgi:hypothetical protein
MLSFIKELIPSGVDCLFMLKISLHSKGYIKTYPNKYVGTTMVAPNQSMKIHTKIWMDRG